MTKEKKSMGLIKKQKPFANSDRYYRGRIIDVLRLGSVIEKKLIDDLVHEYGKSSIYFSGIISGLLKDGLIERKNKIVRLPQ